MSDTINERQPTLLLGPAGAASAGAARYGEVAEWLKAPVSKTGIPLWGIAGSNPALSAIQMNSVSPSRQQPTITGRTAEYPARRSGFPLVRRNRTESNLIPSPFAVVTGYRLVEYRCPVVSRACQRSFWGTPAELPHHPHPRWSTAGREEQGDRLTTPERGGLDGPTNHRRRLLDRRSDSQRKQGSGQQSTGWLCDFRAQASQHGHQHRSCRQTVNWSGHNQSTVPGGFPTGPVAPTGWALLWYDCCPDNTTRRRRYRETTCPGATPPIH